MLNKMLLESEPSSWSAVTHFYAVSLVSYRLRAAVSQFPHWLDVDSDLLFFPSSPPSLRVQPLFSLLQPEDGMVRMQSPLKLEIRAATLLIALPCFKMCVSL